MSSKRVNLEHMTLQRTTGLLSFLSLWVVAGCAASSSPPTEPTSTPSASSNPASASTHDESTHDESIHHESSHEHGSRTHSFDDPERYVAAWNDPERDVWQKPHEIVMALALERGATVVDLGTGTGYLLPPLSQAVGPSGQVIAADIEPAMLRFVEDAAKEEGWSNVRTHRSSPDSPALPAASVDGVVTLNTWHHVEDRKGYARELYQVLRPGAAFVVVDFLPEPTEGFGPPQSIRLSAEQVATELEAGGFDVEIVPETMPRHYMVRGIRPPS